jgi:hypothetical protein
VSDKVFNLARSTSNSWVQKIATLTSSTAAVLLLAMVQGLHCSLLTMRAKMLLVLLSCVLLTVQCTADLDFVLRTEADRQFWPVSCLCTCL